MESELDDLIQVERLDDKLTVDNVLRHAIGELSSVIVIGELKEGGFYYASSDKNVAKAYLMASRFKEFLMRNYY